MVNSGQLILISGPTAAGKTDLAMALSDRYPVDLISVDAAQVYRGMNIGTAKPDPKQLRHYPHALIDIRDPEQSYSAAEFRNDALNLIQKSFESGRQPVLVGGTMFYFSALIKGLSSLPAGDAVVRKALEQRAAKCGLAGMHDELASIDPVMATKIRASDRQRLLRALEMHQITGEVPSVLFERSRPQPCPWRFLHFALYQPRREVLHDRIRRRYQLMLEHGLVGEVEGLRQRPGLTADCASMRTVGYRQVWSYLSGEINDQDMLDQAVAATRQLAKRQLTWIRNTPGSIWIDANNHDNLAIVDHFLAENRFFFVV